MKLLRGAIVKRSGETARRYNHETNHVEVDGAGGRVAVHFKLASKGGGVTDVRLELHSPTFDRLLGEMYNADPDRMAKLMARQMNAHFWSDKSDKA